MPAISERLEDRTLFAASLLDPTFGGGDGIVTTDVSSGEELAVVVKILSSGKILVAGTAVGSGANAGFDFALVRYNADGSRDNTFGGGDGISTIGFGIGDDFAGAMTVLPSGKILVAGSATVGTTASPGSDFAVARFNSDGSIDNDFGGGDGRVTTPLGPATIDDGRALLALSDGRFLVAGSVLRGSDETGFTSTIAIARYNADGSRDNTFGGGDGNIQTNFADSEIESASALLAAPGGKFYVGGLGDDEAFVVRYNGNGSLDTTFSGDGIAVSAAFVFYGGYGPGVALASRADGDVLLANLEFGQATVSRFNSNGTPETTFGSGGYTQFFTDDFETNAAMGLLSDGKILVNAGSANVARLTADGFADVTFDGEDGVYSPDLFAAIGPSIAEVVAIALQPDGRPVLAGRIIEFNNGGDTQFAILRLKNIQIAAPADADDQINEAIALAVGGSRTASINIGTDVDMHKFTAKAGQRIDFDLDRPTGSSLDSILRLFDSSGSEIAVNDDGGAPGEAAGLTESYLRHFFTTAGTYYIGVSGSVNGSYDALSGARDVAGSTGGYVLRLSDVPVPPDADDQISEAVAITVAEGSRAGSIAQDLDVDLFKFTATAGQRIGFDIDVQGTSRLDSHLRLFKADGTELANNGNDAAPGELGNLESYLDFTFATAGTYFIGVSGAGNSEYNAVSGASDVPGSIGSYTLDLTNIITIDTDDQTSEAVAFTPGTKSGAITTLDVDMFSFTATAGQFVQLDLDHPAGSVFDSSLRLFSSTGEEIALSFDDRAPGENFTLESYIEFLVPTTGKYFVGVSGSENTNYDAVTGQGDSAGSKGNYLLTLTISAKPPNLDPDDQISEAVALGATTVNAAIGSQGDVDMFTFTLTKPEAVVFELNNPDLFGVLRVFDAAGNELGIFENFNFGNDFFSHTFDAAGKYYLGISGSFNDIYIATTGLGDRGTETGSYSLTLRRDADDQLSERRFVTNGAELDDAISNAFDVDMYAISGITGEEWTFSVTTPTSNLPAYLTLFDSDGVRLEFDGPEGAVRVRFPSTGVFYFGVSSGESSGYNPVTGGDDFPGELGAYHVSVRKVTPDPDDQISEARPLVLGVARSDTIGTLASDVDMYSFQATAGKPLAIDLDRPAGGLSGGWLTLYDAAGNELNFSTDPSAPGELVDKEAYLELLPTRTGTYYVGVSNSENFFYNAVTGNFDVNRGAGGAYTITLSEILEADDQLSEAVSVAVGTSRTSSIGTTSDVDLIKFTVTSAGQRIGIDLDRPTGSTLDSALRLFNSSGNNLASSDDAAAPGETVGTESYVEFVFNQAGTYYVGVAASDNATYDPITGLGKQTGNSIGGYTLRINRLA